MAQPEPTWDSPEQADLLDQSSENLSDEKQTAESEGSVTFKPTTVTCPQDQHFFYYTESMAVKCRGCPVGYTLSAGSYLKDGHIYMGEQLLI